MFRPNAIFGFGGIAMFDRWRRKLVPVSFAAMILTSCLPGSGVAAIVFAQVSGAENVAASYPREINIRQAREKMNAGAFFLDVRERREWEEVRIPGAVLIPMNQLEGRINEIPKDKDVVVVCASGSRSRMALDILRREGLEKSSSMSGGIRLWRQAGYPIEQGKLP